MKDLERRSVVCEVRADEERENVIVGRPVVYGQQADIGLFYEIIEAGALNGTDLRDVRFLVNHDTSRIPLARSRRNNASSTMQLMPDDEGLQSFTFLDTENNSESRALYSAVQRGDISGMSIMFSVDEDVWENLQSEKPLRRVKKIGSIVEISACTFPAYEATEIYARSKEALESARATLESARQRNAAPLESGNTTGSMEELDLLHAKTLTLTGGK